MNIFPPNAHKVAMKCSAAGRDVSCASRDVKAVVPSLREVIETRSGSEGRFLGNI